MMCNYRNRLNTWNFTPIFHVQGQWQHFLAFFQILNFANMPKFGKSLPLKQFSEFKLRFNIQVLPWSCLKFKSFRLITSVKILHSKMLPTAFFLPKTDFSHFCLFSEFGELLMLLGAQCCYMLGFLTHIAIVFIPNSKNHVTPLMSRDTSGSACNYNNRMG